MKLFVGTSGFSYPAWKGSFYPSKLPQKAMLNFYAERFDTVEMNNTFYRLPSAEAVESWMPHTPNTFRFAIKAPQTITHRKRLKNAGDAVDELLAVIAVLKHRLGPVLFQLPPNFKKDLRRLDEFLSLLAGRVQAAFEFRHATWQDDEVLDCLRKHGCIQCIADAEDLPVAAVVATANCGYLRLRRENYSDAQLATWIAATKSQPWDEAYVYFKHEESGTGPKLAARWMEIAGS